MYEPKIFAFLCNWCSYAGADLAGVSRLQYPTNIRIIRVMCSGRIDPYFLFEALRLGSDGILITGCHPADCHYISGNYNAIYKILFAKKLLEKVGINPDRIKLEWVSASEAERFRTVVTEYTENTSKLGSLAEEDPEFEPKLKLLQDVCADFNFRWLVGKSRELIHLGNVYNETKTEEEYVELVDKILDAELLRHKILNVISEDPKTAIDIADELSMAPNLVMKHLLALKTKQKVQIRMFGHDAKFAVIEE